MNIRPYVLMIYGKWLWAPYMHILYGACGSITINWYWWFLRALQSVSCGKWKISIGRHRSWRCLHQCHLAHYHSHYSQPYSLPFLANSPMRYEERFFTWEFAQNCLHASTPRIFRPHTHSICFPFVKILVL